MQLAPPNQVVVTGTVRDLVAGSSVSFFNAGVHELKGVAGTWPIWQVASGIDSTRLPVADECRTAARRS
jgi:class 3 adenylate cyclase